jgi:DNA-binding transcriptional LysR family regulator
MIGERSLRALCAFVETGSVSEAALRLGRTQPQVGRLLGALEEAAGFPVFSRARRRLTLTESGRRLYEEAQRVLAGHNALERLAAEIRSGQRDEHVRLLIAPRVMPALIGEALRVIREEVPGFTCVVESRERMGIESWIGHVPFDLGITVLPLSHPSIAVEPFERVDVVAAMHPSHPLAGSGPLDVRALAKVEIILSHPASLVRQQVDRSFAEAGIEPARSFEASTGATACQLAAQGLGVAVVDPFVALSTRQALVMRPFRPAIPLPYAFIYPNWRPRPPLVSRLAAVIGAVARRQVTALLLDV